MFGAHLFVLITNVAPEWRTVRNTVADQLTGNAEQRHTGVSETGMFLPLQTDVPLADHRDVEPIVGRIAVVLPDDVQLTLQQPHLVLWRGRGGRCGRFQCAGIEAPRGQHLTVG